MKTYTITEETLKSWLHDLEYFLYDDVTKEIQAVLEKEPSVPAVNNTILRFEDIQIGDIYKFRADVNTKKNLHNKQVKITDKKKTNVVGEIVGTNIRYRIPPSVLERVNA